MPSELQSLSTIFNTRMFRVPDYQRGYSWGEPQLIDLWDDLNRLNANRKHYTGQLTLEKVMDSELKSWGEETWLIDGGGYTPYFVVDGQQRLTTAIILIKCILDRMPDGQQLAFVDKSDHVKKYLFQKSGISNAFVFGYQRDNPSYDYFKNHILAVPQISYEGIETTYTSNLLYARNFFRDKLKNVDISELERLYKSITQRFVFSVNELVDDLDVFVAFETMNNRGKKLSALELLKNRLIYLSTMLPSPGFETERRTLRKNINDAWKTVFEFLGREKGTALDDDQFLRAHWAMYFSYNRSEASTFDKFLLNKHFTPGRVGKGEVTASDLQQYVASLQASVRKWYDINFPHRANLLGDTIRGGLERLGRLGRGGAFKPLLMAALQISDDESDLMSLLKAAERFVFVVRLCGIRADTGDSEFYRLAHELFDKKTTLYQVAQAIDDRTYRHFSKDKAITEARELFHNSIGFYSWDELRYFLFEYEQHLREQARKEERKIDWNDLKAGQGDHATIEHIFPQTPGFEEWPAFAGLTKKDIFILTNSLGNLLALSRSRNSSFSNRAFATKKQDANGVKGYYNGSYSEIEVAQASDWTPEAILKRGLEMLDFLERRWKVCLGSRQDKIRFLHLDILDVS